MKTTPLLRLSCKKILFTTIVSAFFSLFIFSSAYAQNCTVNAGIDQITCPRTSVSLQGNVGGFYIDTTVKWNFVSGPATPVITTPKSLSTTVTGLTVPGVYVFSLSSTCNISSATDFVNITIKAGATAVTPMGSFAGCYTPGTPISLVGIAPAGHTIRWTVSSSAGNKGTFNGATAESFTGNSPTVRFPALPNGFCATGTVSHTITLVSTNTASGCTESRTLVLAFRYNLGAVTAFVPSACGTCATLLGTCAQDGVGTWSIVSQPAGSSASITGINNATTTICNLIPGVYRVRWSVAGGTGCVIGADTATFTAGGAGPGTTAKTKSIYFCDSIPASVSISGNVASATEKIKWLQISGLPATITNDSTSTTTVTGLTSAGAPYIFVYSITNVAGCGSYDTMRIVTKPATITIGTGAKLCNASSLTNVKRTLTNSFIRSFASDSLVVQVQYVSGPMDTIGSNFHFINREGSVNSLSLPTEKCAVKVARGGSFTQQWRDSEIWKVTKITNSNMALSIIASSSTSGGCTGISGLGCGRIKDGNYVFNVSIYDGCKTYTQAVTISYGATASVTSGTDQMLPCGFDSTTLAGVTNRAVDCNWRPFWNTIQTPTGAPNPINATNLYNLNAPLQNLVDGTYLFQLTGDPGGSSTCVLNIDTVQVVVASALPQIPTITGAPTLPICANIPVSLVGSADSVTSMGTWTIVSSTPVGASGSFLPSVNSPQTVFVPSAPSTTYNIRWTVQNGCGSVFDQIAITTNALFTSVPAITNPDCNQGGSLSSLNASPSGGIWSTDNPNYTITNSTATTPTVTPAIVSGTLGAATFFYTLDNTTSGGCGTVRDSVTFLANSTLIVNAGNFCNVVSFPTTIPIYFSNISPNQRYSLIASGPSNPFLSKSEIFKSGAAFAKDTLLLTVNAPGTYFVGSSSYGLNNCVTAEQKTVIFEVSNPSPLALAGVDTFLCNSNSMQLNAEPNVIPNPFTGFWTVDTIYSGAVPTFNNASLPNATVTFASGGDVRLKWQLYGGNPDCANTSFDYRRVTYYPTAAAGRDTTLCFSAPTGFTSYNLGANSSIPSASGVWSIMSEPAGSNAFFADNKINNTSIQGLIGGQYILRWTISQDTSCTTFDEMSLNIDNTCAALPINFTDFNATKNDCDVRLDWTIQGAENVNAYYVQKKIEDKFVTIATIQSNTLEAVASYFYNDINAGNGKKEYRIEVENEDGSYYFSNISGAQINCTKNSLIQVYPNPAQDEINVYLNLEQEDFVTLTLRSMTGQLIFESKSEISLGAQKMLIPIKQLVAGSYLLEVRGESFPREAIKIQKAP